MLKKHRSLLLLACTLFSMSSSSLAKDQLSKREATKQANDLLSQALKAEATGDLSKREQLLQQAASLAAIPEAKWQGGYLQDARGKWISIEESMAEQYDDQKFARYDVIRSKTPRTVNAQMDLARWCIQMGMLDQARSHLHQVILLDHDNVRARRALGYQNVNNEWISPNQVQNFAKKNEVTKAALSKYGHLIQKVVRNLNSQNEKVQDAARREMDAHGDADIVPAVEAYFTNHPQHALIGVEWLVSVDCVESSQALVKFALMHEDSQVRQSATAGLKSRPLHDYVPDLLAMLSTPISSTLIPAYDEQGNLTGYTQALTQEKFDRRDILSVETRVRSSGPASRGQQLLESQMQQALNPQTSEEAELAQTKSAAELQRQNKLVEDRNTRIGTLIASVANVSYSGDARELWTWWDSYNETEYQEYKPERYQSSSQELTIVDTDDDDNSGECFVEGTPIATSRGMKPIEQVAVGDMVLSRDINTGRLDWKPVLRATRRPPEATRVLTVGDEQIQCTTGHLLWVSGEGWKKASEIHVGDILHCAKEPVAVSKVVESDTVETFNLDVADFGTYFAGKAMILSHDVKPRAPNRFAVPGLKLISTTRPVVAAASSSGK